MLGLSVKLFDTYHQAAPLFIAYKITPAQENIIYVISSEPVLNMYAPTGGKEL